MVLENFMVPIAPLKCFDREKRCPICAGCGICRTISGGGTDCLLCQGTGDITKGRRLRKRQSFSKVKHQ